MALILEVLQPRTGAVLSRRRLTAFPFSVGRGFDNALVLDDPHVDAHHATIRVDEATGDVLVEDLGSVNGLQTDLHARAEIVRVRAGAEVRLGRTTLRFRDEAEALPPAIPLHAAPDAGPTRWHDRALVRVAFCIATFAFLGWLSWLGTASRDGANAGLMAAFGFAGLNAIWAGIWALVARVVIQQGRFLAHFTIATFFMLLVMLMAEAGKWVSFLLPDGTAWSVLSGALTLVLLAASIAYHLANATHLSRARRWRAGAIVSAVVVALGGAVSLADDEGFTDVPTFDATVLPLRPALVPTLSADELRAVHAKLRETVDSLPDDATDR